MHTTTVVHTNDLGFGQSGRRRGDARFTTVDAVNIKSLRRRLRYRIDNVLSRGTWAVLLWLGAATVLTVLFSSLLLAIFNVQLGGSQDGSWLEDFWQSTMRILDPGTMSGDVGWGRRLLALFVTLFGVLIAGTLIGIIAAGVENRVEPCSVGAAPSSSPTTCSSSARRPGWLSWWNSSPSPDATDGEMSS